MTVTIKNVNDKTIKEILSTKITYTYRKTHETKPLSWILKITEMNRNLYNN